MTAGAQVISAGAQTVMRLFKQFRLLQMWVSSMRASKDEAANRILSCPFFVKVRPPSPFSQGARIQRHGNHSGSGLWHVSSQWFQNSLDHPAQRMPSKIRRLPRPAGLRPSPARRSLL